MTAQKMTAQKMTAKTSDYPLVIVGAGAAGLGAAEQAKKAGVECIVLEASHRIGGRGLTEYLEGNIAVDLGCHWMHCGSKNPYVKWADKLGFEYEKPADLPPSRHYFQRPLGQAEAQGYAEFEQQCARAMRQLYQDNPSAAVSDAIDMDSRWARLFCYWMSLMHSNDIDQVAVRDVLEFAETNEDWAVKQGYGALIVRQGADVAVRLNCEVQRIDWGGSHVVLQTNQGTITAARIILTVSTGVLEAGQIAFTPPLPPDKRDSIAALPLGNSNYQFFSLDAAAAQTYASQNIHYENSDHAMTIRIQPFNSPCVFTSTGGRFAWWLEKQGVQASREYLEAALVDIFGVDIRAHLGEFKVSAWGFDQWIRGAYSSQLPTSSSSTTSSTSSAAAVNSRALLAMPLEEKIYFAGEATSPDQFNTAHGAYLSGKLAVKLALKSA